jgi:hypothetical protein
MHSSKFAILAAASSVCLPDLVANIFSNSAPILFVPGPINRLFELGSVDLVG